MCIRDRSYRIVVSPHLATIPLFTLAGYFLAESKASDRLINVFKACFGWLPGGTPVIVLLICGFFTALTGGSGVTILALGGLLFPMLYKDGYKKNFSLGLITASGSIGLLFPPSLPLILYGVTAGISIKSIFLAGIIPGVFLIVILSIWSYLSGNAKKIQISDFDGDARLWDWGSLDIEDEESEDCQIANWAVNILSEDNKKPFWLGVGFFKPHVPFIAPKKWFDQYPLESIQLPEIIDGDLNDISEYAKSLSRYGHVAPSHKWVVSNNQWRSLVRSYLACVSFVDDQVGKVLDALERSDKAQNTYVVLYSDHGFHLGEKEKWAKRSLWKNSTKVPLIISGPGIPKGKTCDLPVQLLDIYPTQLELSGLASDPIHQGNSLVPILKKGAIEWPYVARTSIGPGNYSIVSKNYRFIQYNDNTAELYDRINDPNEWYNLINNPDLSDVIEEHRNKIPNQRHEILGDGSLGHESYSFSEKGILDPN